MRKIKTQGTFLLSILLFWCLSAGGIVRAAIPDQVLIGGMPFGIKFFSQGVMVVGFSEIPSDDGQSDGGSGIPAYDAGIRVNDRITAVDGEPVRSSGELVEHIEKSCDAPIRITYIRGGSENTVSMIPRLDPDDGKRKTGMWIRDTTAGIGTVTYILPDSGVFAGLGHGICSSENGELLPMEHGTVVNVRISGVSRGMPGTPGELKGYFTSDKSGVLLGNTLCGVYGILSDVPDGQPVMSVGSRSEVHEGDACIWCTLDDNAAHCYGIRISDIDRGSSDNRSFTITVTDPVLLERTGGIVQGMSGSPIVQDGKLIGAVTHVLVNVPSQGYGIFIDNMMEAAGSIVS